MELTPAGQRLLQHARLVMRQVDYLKNEFTDYGGDGAGHIRIFANTTATTEFLPEILARFLSTRPGVTIDLQETPDARHRARRGRRVPRISALPPAPSSPPNCR